MAARKILFIDADPASRRYVAGALGQEGYEVELAASGQEGLLAAERQQPDLILVDPAGKDLSGEELAARLRADPLTVRVPLVALSSDTQATRLKTCMQAGFSDYLVKSPAVMPALVASLAQLLPRREPEASAGGRLIAFLSAKGGTGTSTLCANIAMNMADCRPEARVVVADLVLPIGSIAGIVGYQGAQDVVSLSQLPAVDISGEFLGGRLPKLDAWGFHLVAGSPDPERGNALSVGRIGDIVAGLQRTYDFVVLDLGRSLSRISLPLIQRADLIVLIVGTDPTTVALSKTVWEYLQRQGIQPSSVYVIMNRAVGQEGMTKDEAEKMLGLRSSAAVPHQADNFSLANGHHQPYCDRFPGDTTSIVLREAALQMMELAGRARAG